MHAANKVNMLVCITITYLFVVFNVIKVPSLLFHRSNHTYKHNASKMFAFNLFAYIMFS